MTGSNSGAAPASVPAAVTSGIAAGGEVRPVIASSNTSGYGATGMESVTGGNGGGSAETASAVLSSGVSTSGAAAGKSACAKGSAADGSSGPAGDSSSTALATGSGQ